jgi:hypothetical protein
MFGVETPAHNGLGAPKPVCPHRHVNLTRYKPVSRYERPTIASATSSGSHARRK